MQLTGIHHLTAISADAPGNKRFYTGTMGMRMVKKTVNQDDTSAYQPAPRPIPFGQVRRPGAAILRQPM